MPLASLDALALADADAGELDPELDDADADALDGAAALALDSPSSFFADLLALFSESASPP